MSDLYSGTDLFSEFDRLQRQMASLFGGFPSSIRAGRLGAFPQVNIGTTDDSIEIVAFAPGVNAAELDVSIDKGLLTISGERKPAQVGGGEEARDDTRDEPRTYAQERFAGAFRRVIELPQNADPDKVQARYTNGCLSITVGKREASKPRAITVQ
ncbi:Hsp20/alpha crystallin family protein [Paraburkholderia sediminicola]|uniref:Hsp20/alpha crystallin family protein n=1 Tax=Paraburkholderia sediminicola TaxID=458836 RepID=UPI0038B75CD6